MVPSFTIFLTAILFSTALFAADPVKEIASFSAFKSLNASDLAGGGILSERGDSPNFDRGISVQTCYVVKRSVEETARLLASWNPAPHKELEVYSAEAFGAATEPRFGQLRLDPEVEPMRRLLEETHQAASETPSFQISASDPALLRKVISPEAADRVEPDSDEFRKLAQQFWSSLLKQRLEAFRSGGITALPPYQLDEQNVPIHGELIALLSQAPSIQARFRELLSEAVLQPSSKAPSPPAGYYWQIFNSDRKAGFCLGAVYTRQNAGRWQVADYQLYSSHSYLTMITLYELWPLDTGTTLVWRGDFLSAPSFSSLRGVEQMAASALMTKSIKNNIRFFQADAAHLSVHTKPAAHP